MAVIMMSRKYKNRLSALKPQAIATTASLLVSQPKLFSSFLSDAVTCSHSVLLKEWDPYKYAIGMIQDKQRHKKDVDENSVPCGFPRIEKPSRIGNPKELQKIFRAHDKDAVKPFKQIPLHTCWNQREEKWDYEKMVKLIMHSDAEPTIKAELLIEPLKQIEKEMFRKNGGENE
jgi:hypothetical protein